MTPTAMKTLKTMNDAHIAEEYDASEIVCHKSSCWLGVSEVSGKTLRELLGCMAVSHDNLGGADHYTINDTGRALIRRPEIEVEIFAALRSGGAFTIKDDRVQPLDAAS